MPVAIYLLICLRKKELVGFLWGGVLLVESLQKHVSREVLTFALEAKAPGFWPPSRVSSILS